MEGYTVRQSLKRTQSESGARSADNSEENEKSFLFYYSIQAPNTGNLFAALSRCQYRLIMPSMS